MFFLGYLRSELVRRKSRTILTVLGLAVGVSLVIAVSSLSRGLDDAQAKALNPLSSIGTDLTVTLAPQTQDASQGGGPGGGGFGGGREVIEANQSVITDLSKLGKPGDKFVHDFFLPGTQLTFPQTTAAQIAKVDGVASVSSGLVLAAVHQSGTVPKIVAKIKAGGQQIQVNRQIPRPTAAEFAAMQTCLQKAGITVGARAGWRRAATAGGPARRRSRWRRRRRSRWRRPERVRQVPAGPAAALPRHDHDARADAAAGGQSAADEHQELHLHDRRRRSDDAGHRRRHGRPRLERPLHRREQGRAAPTRRCSRAPTRAVRT